MVIGRWLQARVLRPQSCSTFFRILGYLPYQWSLRQKNRSKSVQTESNPEESSNVAQSGVDIKTMSRSATDSNIHQPSEREAQE